MGLCNSFLVRGSQGQGFKEHDFFNQDLPQVSLDEQPPTDFNALAHKTCHSYNDRIDHLQVAGLGNPIRYDIARGGETGIYRIDGVLRVNSATTGERRAREQKFWTSYRNWSLLTGIVGLAVVGGSSVALSAAATPLITVALSVTMVVFALLSSVSFARAWEAHTQMKKWREDPIEAIAQLRTLAYQKEGFFEALRLGLKGSYDLPSDFDGERAGVLHPAEVAYLYGQSFETQKQKFEEVAALPAAAKVALLDAFIKESVLQETAIFYAYPDQDPMCAALASGTRAYSLLKQKIEGVNDFFKSREKEVLETYSERKRDLDRKRATFIAPFEVSLASEISTLNREYQALKDRNGALPLEKSREWSERSANIKNQYRLLEQPIEMFYASELNRLNTWRDAQLKIVEGNRVEHLTPFFVKARDLFNQAYNAFVRQLSRPPLSEASAVRHAPAMPEPSKPLEEVVNYNALFPLPSAPEAPPEKEWEKLATAPGGPSGVYQQDLAQASSQ